MTHSGARAPHAGATYVFAVCRLARAAAVDIGDLTGMPGGEGIRLVFAGSLAAVAQTVPADDFTDTAWQARLTDRRELETYARAHHAVVSTVAARYPTVPLPLATLYHDDERVQRTLTAEADRFHEALRRIAHHAEWGVKVYAPDVRVEEPDPDPTPAPVATAPGAGLAYLNRKRGIQERREWRREEALRLAESVDGELQPFAASSRRLRSPGPAAQGVRRPQMLNATYLIAEHRAQEFALLVDTLRERTGAEIELSGPWVPYSFVGEV